MGRWALGKSVKSFDPYQLTAAINRAKDAGDIKTLREIADDPHGFILRQGWAPLDFSDEAELAQLRRLTDRRPSLRNTFLRSGSLMPRPPMGRVGQSCGKDAVC
jgi:hypothetical protein